MRAIYILLLMCASSLVEAQIYNEQKSQHRFAQTYVGLNWQAVPSAGKLFVNELPQKFPALSTPRLTIGGLHFWGKWDFNMNLPLTVFMDEKIGPEQSVAFNPGGDLSARYYPWRLAFEKVRPYVGLSVNSMNMTYEDQRFGERYDSFFTSSLVVGCAYAINDWQLNAELIWMPSNERTFYTSETTKQQFDLPPVYFSVGIVRYFDTTIKNEKPKKSGLTQQIENALNEKLNSLSIGIAPSASYFIAAPDLDQQSLPRHKGSFNWDLGVGYLFHHAGVHAGLAYRTSQSNVLSYSLEHVIKRRSLAVEVYKFLLDYNGFVPYIGPSFSFERWGVGLFEDDVQVGATALSQKASLGIIFGWDIVPSPLETWVLRTNLRYYPFQEITLSNGRKGRVDQFEFNFIQFVLYPGRLIRIPRARKQFLK